LIGVNGETAEEDVEVEEGETIFFCFCRLFLRGYVLFSSAITDRKR
jgi:hypothetical protein